MEKHHLFLLIVCITCMIFCCVGCGSKNESDSNTIVEQKSEAPVSVSNEVPQTYEEWVKKYGDSAPKAVPASAKKLNKSSVSGNKVVSKKPQYGQSIPASVYEDTLPGDKFYWVIRGNKKVVFFTGADCHIGQGYKKELSDILTQYNLYNYYHYMPDLHPDGSSISVVCKKQRSLNCVENYLYSNCMSNVCIINPSKRAIVIVPHDRAKLERQLVNLKNW